MKRTKNGILIPDVPIMGSGNLPTAVKGFSGDGKLDPYAVPFYVRVHSYLPMVAVNGLEISDNMKTWQPTETVELQAGIYYFRAAAGFLRPRFGTIDGGYTSGIFDFGGNINSLVSYNYADDKQIHSYSFDGAENFMRCEFFYLQRADELLLPSVTDYQSRFDSLFARCKGLYTAPEFRMERLPAITNGFRETQVNRIVCTSQSYVNCQDWLTSTPGIGTFVKKRGAVWPSGTSGIPAGWTIEEED